MRIARTLGRTLVTGTLLLTTLGIAHADLKVVEKMTLDGPLMGALGGPGGPGGRPNKPAVPTETITLHKGNKTRVETPELITVTDSDAGTVLFIYPKRKTYSIVKQEDMLKSLEGTLPPFIDMMEVKAKVDLKEGGHEKTIAGKKAKDYLWTATLSMSMKGADGEAAGELANITIEGEQWTTEEVVPPGKPSKNLPRGVGGGMMGMAGGMMKMMEKMPGAKAVQDKLATIKGFALLTTVKTTVKSPMAEAQGMDLSKPMVTKNEIITLSEEAISDSLFAPPMDFKKVPYEAPRNPFGGFGG